MIEIILLLEEALDGRISPILYVGNEIRLTEGIVTARSITKGSVLLIAVFRTKLPTTLMFSGFS